MSERIHLHDPPSNLIVSLIEVLYLSLTAQPCASSGLIRGRRFFAHGNRERGNLAV